MYNQCRIIPDESIASTDTELSLLKITFCRLVRLGVMRCFLKPDFWLLWGFLFAAMSCVKPKPAELACATTRLYQMESLQANSNLMPMSTSYYWMYTDSNFDVAGGAVVREVLVTPRQAFVYEHDFLGSPRMFQGLGLVYLPDLAFRGDTIYQLNNDRMLRHGDCHTLGRAWLYPVDMGDTAVVLERDSSLSKLYRSNRPITTAMGTFSDNLVLERTNPHLLYTFNAEAGLLEIGVYESPPAGRLLRRIVLKEFNRGL